MQVLLLHKQAVERLVGGLESKPSFSVMVKNTQHYHNKLNRIWRDTSKECYCTEEAVCENCIENQNKEYNWEED